MQPTPAFVPGKFHRQRSLVDYSPCGCKELDMTEYTHTHTHTHTQRHLLRPKMEFFDVFVCLSE